MTDAPPSERSSFTDLAVTLDAEVSPRKSRLVGLTGIAEVLARLDPPRVNPTTGEPLSLSRISFIVDNPAHGFPKPWTMIDGRRRAWREADVEEWGRNWDWPVGRPRKPNLQDADV